MPIAEEGAKRPHDPWIEVVYPEHFPPGLCILGVVVPTEGTGITHEFVTRIVHATRPMYEPPEVIGDWEYGPGIRLVWKLPELRAEQKALLLQGARDVAEWAHRQFRLTAVVRPVRNLAQAHIILAANRL